MRKIILLSVMCLTAVLFTMTSPAVYAQESMGEEIFAKSGAEEIYDSLDGETKKILSGMGVDGADGQTDGDGVFAVLSELMRDKLAGPMKALASLVGVIILCRMAASMDDGRLDNASEFAGALACAAVVVSPLLKLIEATGQAVEGASVLLFAAVPVYTALMAAGGNAAASSSYSFLAMTVGNLIPVVSSTVVMPMLRVFLALGLVSSVSRLRLDKFAATLYGFAKWLLVLCVTAFSGILSVQTILNAQVDAAGNKTVKLIASSTIPIVGGAFGDAIAAIQNSVQVVKSGVGAFGMLAALCIFAPTAIEAALWSAVCFLGQTAAELFDRPKLGSFLGMCASAARMILAVIAAACAVTLVTAAVVLLIRQG